MDRWRENNILRKQRGGARERRERNFLMMLDWWVLFDTEKEAVYGIPGVKGSG
jgi:hypothetical protein